jgi:hypothetical protein
LDTLDDLYQRKEGNDNDHDNKIVTHHPTMDALYQAIRKQILLDSNCRKGMRLFMGGGRKSVFCFS